MAFLTHRNWRFAAAVAEVVRDAMVVAVGKKVPRTHRVAVVNGTRAKKTARADRRLRINRESL